MSASKRSYAVSASLAAVLLGALALSGAGPISAHAAADGATKVDVKAPRAPEVSRAGVRTPARPAAAPGVVVRVVAVSSVADGQQQVNRCAGPVEVNYSAYGLPNDIVQHNFCGGSWFTTLTNGTRVTVVGGAHPGTYVVNGRKRFIRPGQDIGVLAGIGDLSLQTCVGSVMEFIGLTRV